MSDDVATPQWQPPAAVTVYGNTVLVRSLTRYWREQGAVQSGDITPPDDWLQTHEWLADEWQTLKKAMDDKRPIVVYGDRMSDRARQETTDFVTALRKAHSKVIYLRNVKAPVIAQIAGNRKLSAARVDEMLIKPAKLIDPELLMGMDKTVAVIRQALTEKRKIAVYGDFDADGVNGTVILTRALRAAGAEVIPYIPNIENEGYGLHSKAIDWLARRGVGLLVSTDCGTSSVDEIANRPAGMLVAVTDHHLPRRDTPGGPEVLAPADSLINPEQEADKYPNKELAGSAVAWKVVAELENQGLVPQGTAESLLPYVALGTVGDVMELTGENRTLVTRGMERMRESPPPGIEALIEVAKLNVPRPLLSDDLSYQLIPRINAAGRMGEGQLALKLLLSDSPRYAKHYAKQLDALNARRKEITKTSIEEAKEQIAQYPADAPVYVLSSPNWPKGIVGAMAGRLSHEYNRPIVCIAETGADSKGSARSTGGIKIVDAFRDVADTLIIYGGHDQAAGFSIDAARINDFRTGITAAIAKRLHPSQQGMPAVDATITSKEIGHRLMEQLGRLEPFGNGNEHPTFEILNATVLHCDPLGAEGAVKGHWRVEMIDGARGKGTFKGVIWNDPSAHDRLMTWLPDSESWTGGKVVDIRGQLAWNGWTTEEGEYRQYPQFTIDAYRPHDPVAEREALSRQLTL